MVARLNGVQEAVSSTLATRTKAISRLTDGFFVVIAQLLGGPAAAGRLFFILLSAPGIAWPACRNESIMNGGREVNPPAAILQQKSIMYMNQHKFFVGQNRKVFLYFLCILPLWQPPPYHSNSFRLLRMVYTLASASSAES